MALNMTYFRSMPIDWPVNWLLQETIQLHVHTWVCFHTLARGIETQERSTEVDFRTTTIHSSFLGPTKL